jgi:hypothetical protein
MKQIAHGPYPKLSMIGKITSEYSLEPAFAKASKPGKEGTDALQAKPVLFTSA